MQMNLGKFVHTETGKYVMSVLLGFGLASLFRTVCKDKMCMSFYAPPLDKIKDNVYKTKENGSCIKYVPVPSKCFSNYKIVTFE